MTQALVTINEEKRTGDGPDDNTKRRKSILKPSFTQVLKDSYGTPSRYARPTMVSEELTKIKNS